MKLTGLLMEDFVNYRRPTMFLSTSACGRGCKNCQNEALKDIDTMNVSNSWILKEYFDNGITEGITIGGLEPFDTYEDTLQFYKDFRKYSNDLVVIYTGYAEEELTDQIKQLLAHGGPLIVKYGHYIDGQEKHYDSVLGVDLASDNQYAKLYL